MLNRIKQFYWGLEALIKKDNFNLLNKYLNNSEIQLFMKLSKSERYHCFRVCMSAIKYIKDNNISEIDINKMCRCALLHDIGKSKTNINIIEKSFLVILNNITHSKFLKYNINKRISDYYNHPEIGIQLLEEINNKNIDSDIIICVKYHHSNNFKDKNIYLEILTICDNCN